MSNYKLRSKRLAACITEGQVAEEVARLVAVQTGRELAIDGNYVSRLERGVITTTRSYHDKDGRIRQQILDNPMAGTLSTRSSFAVLLAGAARQTLAA